MATKAESVKTYYFARSAAQAAVLWDPEKDTAIAEFDRFGSFATNKREVAQKVLEAGYHQVDVKDLEARNLPIPTPDASPSVDAQPGAPGRGYQPALIDEVSGLPVGQGEEVDGPMAFTSEFPPGPTPPKPGEKRTLR